MSNLSQLYTFVGLPEGGGVTGGGNTNESNDESYIVYVRV